MRSLGESRGNARGWLIILGVWVFYGLFNTEQGYIGFVVSGRPLPWVRVLGLYMPGMLLWALLTPVIMRLTARFPLDRRGIPIHVGAFVIAGFLDAYLYHLIDPWVNPNGTRPLLVGFVRYLGINLANYVMVVAFTLAARYARQLREREVAAAELQSQLSTAHLRSLQAQLRPHFLFNTLNTIAELVHRDPDTADRLITRLGALLRRSLDSLGDQRVALGAELEFLSDYSEIVTARFRGRVRVVLNVDPDALDAGVPSLILQPLVENAVRHGLEPKADGGTVEVFARRRLDLLELEVRDDGRGLPRDDVSGEAGWHEGVGLQNTSARLKHLYGDAYRFSVRPRVNGGTIVAIQIPFTPIASLHVARGGALPVSVDRVLETA